MQNARRRDPDAQRSGERMSEMPEQYPAGYRADPIVEMVRDKLRARSVLGQQKYGCTLDRDDLHLLEWLYHALEESLDQALYLQAAIVWLQRIDTTRGCCKK